ncbi:SAM-dependent methyltransferase [filamentous cyanobacterium CCP2]|nr:SAM-dependent methyltransferase [filamentous cyanobacterium CCP2]
MELQIDSNILFRCAYTPSRLIQNQKMNQPTPSSTPLHTQNPLGRFSNRAKDYAHYRPSYPSEAIDCILDGMRSPAEFVVADVGAGTGISARLMAERGVHVWAIEPNAAMRNAATPHPLIEFCDATAEKTHLLDQSVDVVLCCQSFHWFNKPVALEEFHRILKPSGRVALMWNDRNLDDPFTQAYSEIISQAAERQIFDQGDRKSGSVLKHSPLFTNYRTHTLFHTHKLDLTGLLGLALSSSYIPKTGTAYEQLMHDLETLHHQWSQTSPNGTVSLAYQVNLHLADRTHSALA